MSRGTGLQVASFGPFLKGVVDGYNPSVPTEGALRLARNAVLTGAGQLRLRNGMDNGSGEFLDDQGTPQRCTTVCALAEFGVGRLAVAHSEVTDKVYLYATTGLAWPVTPSAVLWTGIALAPTVTVAEILGTAYFANDQAFGTLAPSFPVLTHPVQTWDGTTVGTLTADLAGAGAQPVYALGVAAFQSHLLTWGFDAGAVAATAYRPEYLRIGGPNGDPLDSPGKAAFGVGHRVRSPREAITAVCVVGDVCYLGTPTGLWALSGYGRDTWQVTNLAARNGVVGPRAMVGAAGACYVWSERGPMRVTGLAAPDPLWDAIAANVATVGPQANVVAAFDPDTDQVQFHRGTAVNQRAAFDVRREAWLGPDSDVGRSVFCAAVISDAPTATGSTCYYGTTSVPGGSPAGAIVLDSGGGGAFDDTDVDGGDGGGQFVAFEVETWDATPAGPQGACVWRQVTLVHRCEASALAPVTWVVTPYVDGVALAAQAFTRTESGTFAEELYLVERGARLRVHAECTASGTTATAVELIDLAHHFVALSADP